jgi:CubicO group peptidase (beta-lactamase class C family)
MVKKRKLFTVLAIILLLIIIDLNSVVSINIKEEIPSKTQKPIFSNDQNFNRIINFIMKLGKIPSISACIIKDNQIIWSKSYGLYDIINQKNATINTIYLSGSISKAITATAVMQLCEKGLFNLDDNVNEYLDFNLRNPYYPDIPITFRMLLSHTSGLKEEPDEVQISMVEYNDDPPELNSWIKDYFYKNNTLRSDLWFNKKPGEYYCYCSADLCIIAYIVERLSGLSFNDYCKQYIFEPLTMYNTSFYLLDLNKDKIALPYIIVANCNFALEFYSWQMYPSGNLYTTVGDLSHFVIMNMNQGTYKNTIILNSSSINLMHKIQTQNKHKILNYGLGIYIWNFPINEYYYGHPGSMIGYHGLFKIKESDDVSIIYLVNSDINKESGGKILFAILEKMLWVKASQIKN